MSATETPQWFKDLSKYDTPTICNAIELFDVRPRNTGYMNESIKACFPKMPPMVGFALTSTFRSMAAPRGGDVLSGGVPCYGTYRCADDKYMAVGALEGKFWAVCCQVLGHPEWIGRQWDPALRGELEALFASRRRDDWAALFAPADCCVTPVLALEESLENAQLAARGMVLEVDGLRQFAPPLKVSEHPFTIRQAAPKAGEHNEAILRAAGYSVEQIERLVASGALG